MRKGVHVDHDHSSLSMLVPAFPGLGEGASRRLGLLWTRSLGANSQDYSSFMGRIMVFGWWYSPGLAVLVGRQHPRAIWRCHCRIFFAISQQLRVAHPELGDAFLLPACSMCRVKGKTGVETLTTSNTTVAEPLCCCRYS